MRTAPLVPLLLLAACSGGGTSTPTPTPGPTNHAPVFTSAATAVLCLLASLIYRLALPLLDLRSNYGEVFKVMALVTWVFIQSFILILGANLSAYQILPRAWTGRQPQQAEAAEPSAAADE